MFENSPAVVIGAMIIAMLLGPISGVALGLVDRDNQLLKKALATLAGGVAVVYVTAFILGALHQQFPLTGEIYARTEPNLIDLMIGLGGGAAGAYSMIAPRLSVAFVGVAIATALVPPLSSSAICLARGEFSLAFGALLLAFTNIMAIQVAGSVVMWLGGYRGMAQGLQGSAVKRNVLSIAVLCCLAALLGVQLQRMIATEVYKASMRQILNTAAGTHKGAHLAEVRFQRDAGRTDVVAVYRTPTPFTPEEVGALEPRLAPDARNPQCATTNSLDSGNGRFQSRVPVLQRRSVGERAVEVASGAPSLLLQNKVAREFPLTTPARQICFMESGRMSFTVSSSSARLKCLRGNLEPFAYRRGCGSNRLA